MIFRRVSLSKNPNLAARARKQRYAGLREKCCGTRVRGSVPQPQSSSLALPCQILVSVDGCQSLAAFGSCIHWMRAPSRRPITPAGTRGKRVPSGHNRRRRLATRRCDTKRAGTTAVVPATIECQQCLLHLHFFDTLSSAGFASALFSSLSKNPKLAAVARKQRFAALPAGWRGGLRTAVALRAVLVLGAAHP